MASLTPQQIAFVQYASGIFVQLATTGWWEAGAPRVAVTSFYRDVAANRAAGGRPNSQHLIGTALDLVAQERKVDLIGRWRARGLTVVDEGTHLHVQLWPASARAVESIAPQLIG